MEISASSGLSLAHPEGLDEEEQFICCVLASKAYGIAHCLLLAILMTSKCDRRPLAEASWTVALCPPLPPRD